MKEKNDLLNTLLVLVLLAVLLTAMLVRILMPAVVLPPLNIPNMALISLAVLLLERRLAPNARRSYGCIALLAAAAFGLLPWAAGLAELSEVWRLGLAGGVVFAVCTWLFTSVCQRLSSGPRAKAAPFISALLLYLAAQCFAGILL